MENSNNIYEILALMYEDSWNDSTRQDKKTICLKYKNEIMEFLKKNGIEEKI